MAPVVSRIRNKEEERGGVGGSEAPKERVGEVEGLWEGFNYEVEEE